MTRYAPVGVIADVTLGKMLQPVPKLATDRSMPYLRAAHVQPGGRIDFDVVQKEMWFGEADAAALDLKQGDTVVVEGGAGFGRSAYLERDLPNWGFQNSILRLRGESASDGRYLAYALSSALDSGAIDAACDAATFAHFTAEKVGRFRVPFHSPDERRRIADYLDRETGEIDAMLAKMEELTETLEARRTSVVDRELLPYVGVSTARLGLVAEAITGLTYAPADVVDSGGTVVHRSGSIQKSRIDRADLIRVATPIPDKLRLRDGDLLVCSRNGSAHLVGKNAIIGKEEVGETWGAFMTVLRSPNNRYLRWYLQSTLFADERSQYSTSTINQLTIGMINRMEIPFPPLDEQTRIADHLEEVTGKIDQMLAKTAELKSLLIERRSALIADVVTGKKQVRS